MQSASVTARLHLPQWGRTDKFVRADFDEAFAIIDNTPGVTNVPNYQALPTGLTAAQHGSLYHQLDNGALWAWRQPNNGAPGAFLRRNSLGVLGTALRDTQMYTTAKTQATSSSVVSQSVTAAGGRTLAAEFVCSLASINSSAPFGYFGILHNTEIIGTYQWESAIGTTVTFTGRIPAEDVDPGSSHNFDVRVWGGYRSGATGTQSVRVFTSYLTIKEE